MRRKRLTVLLTALLGFSTLAAAQSEDEFFSLPDTVTNEYLDSLTINVRKPNDYWMIGAYGGAALQYGYFNPTRYTRWQVQYPVFGFSLVRYFTMFGVFPNMGFEIGAQQNYEGYEFKENKETGAHPTESGAYSVKMRVPEAFLLSHFHFDMGEHFKLIAKLGLYGGYRLDISRTLDEAFVGSSYEQYVNSFRDYDRRLTYGVQGGLGAAVMLSPIEIHLNVQVKWGWSSYWAPDYASPYYYRFGYPLDGAVTLGVYYQLTPRYGHTLGQLKKLAKKMVEESQNK